MLQPTSSLDALLERLSPEAHLRGKEFERAAKWFLETDPAYASELQEVWLWRDWPGRWGPDIGIDLVAETQEGKLWAIQAKCYDPESQVPTSEIDSFIATSSRPEFDHRLLISTGQLSKNAEYKLTHQDKPTTVLLYQQLIESPVDWLAFLDDSRPALPDKKTPRPHQQKAIDDVIDGFSANDRGRLIMACGTGKTLVGVWVAERLKSVRTLVLVPSLSLVTQVSLEWQTNSTEPFRALFVCSDQKVADDNFVSSTAELGHAVTADPGDIQRFMSGDGASVVFSTYQSSPEIAAAQASGAPAFDLVIADEAHHCAGKVDSQFSTVLDADSLKATRRLFMTATPRYLSRRIKDSADQLDIQVSSMDDLEVFGPEMHVLTFGKAIEDGLLSDYQVLILGITDTEIAELTHDRRFVEVFGPEFQTDAGSLAYQVGMIKAVREYDLRCVLTFHNRVAHAQDFIASLQALNDVLPPEESLTSLWTSHVSGKMGSNERSQILKQFKNTQGRVNLLSNARCLGEGVDVPGIDGVGFIDPRKSPIDIAQAVGRAIRKSEPEKTGTIVLPVFLDEHSGLSPEEQLEDSRFDAVWNVLNALRAHDDVLAENLDSLRYQLGRFGRVMDPIPGKIVIDLPVSVGIEFVNAIETKIISTTTVSWNFWYGLLEKFTASEGHARPTHDYKEEGYNLGIWLSHQRNSRDNLTPERIARLEALPGWLWDVSVFQWEEGFSALLRFSASEGHARPPKPKNKENASLGAWVAKQRSSRDKLTPEQVSRLEALPGWAWNVPEFQWEEGFLALQRFTATEGHSRPIKDHKESGYNLGAWVKNQRRSRNKLIPGQVARLEALPGWVWDVLEFQWEEGFSALQRFTASEGHARPIKGQEGDEDNLHSWVVYQRTSRNNLTPERVERLEALTGWTWDGNAFPWEEGFESLQIFTARKGHARPPHAHKEEGFNLGFWVNVQRGSRDNLTPERTARLEALPGWAWGVLEFQWAKGFSSLQRFTARKGHARPLSSHKENGDKLGAWVVKQRSFRDRLTPEQVSQLEALPGWAWDTYEFRWEEGFSSLRRFTAREGRARPPKGHKEEGYNLGSWVNVQRGSRDKLTPERIARLEALPGWVWKF
jgi:superfamily II DNA or RNA helicase